MRLLKRFRASANRQQIRGRRGVWTLSLPFEDAREWLTRTISNHRLVFQMGVCKVCLAFEFRLHNFCNYIFVSRRKLTL